MDVTPGGCSTEIGQFSFPSIAGDGNFLGLRIITTDLGHMARMPASNAATLVGSCPSSHISSDNFAQNVTELSLRARFYPLISHCWHLTNDCIMGHQSCLSEVLLWRHTSFWSWVPRPQVLRGNGLGPVGPLEKSCSARPNSVIPARVGGSLPLLSSCWRACCFYRVPRVRQRPGLVQPRIKPTLVRAPQARARTMSENWSWANPSNASLPEGSTTLIR